MVLSLLKLLVLNAFDSELVSHAVVDYASWQLLIGVLLDRAIVDVKNLIIDIVLALIHFKRVC